MKYKMRHEMAIGKIFDPSGVGIFHGGVFIPKCMKPLEFISWEAKACYAKLSKMNSGEAGCYLDQYIFCKDLGLSIKALDNALKELIRYKFICSIDTNKYCFLWHECMGTTVNSNLIVIRADRG